jgi:CDP-diglyceride synthetase
LVAAIFGATALLSFAILAWLRNSSPWAFDLPHELPDHYWWVNPLMLLLLVSLAVSIGGLLLFGAKRDLKGEQRH